MNTDAIGGSEDFHLENPTEVANLINSIRKYLSKIKSTNHMEEEIPPFIHSNKEVSFLVTDYVRTYPHYIELLSEILYDTDENTSVFTDTSHSTICVSGNSLEVHNTEYFHPAIVSEIMLWLIHTQPPHTKWVMEYAEYQLNGNPGNYRGGIIAVTQHGAMVYNAREMYEDLVRMNELDDRNIEDDD